MRRITKVWLIIAAAFMLLGFIIFTGVMTTLKWDFMKLATTSYETSTYNVYEEFDDILIDTDAADIRVLLSDDGECRVECYEEVNTRHSVVVNNGTLTVELIDNRTVQNFIGHIGLDFGSPKITVYLPEAKYQSLVIDENTGDVSLENISVDTLDISVNTGDVSLTDIASKNIISSGNTGSIYLNNVIAEEKLSVERNTGDVEFKSCDAAEIYVNTDTGSVTGSLLSDKVFITDTNTGSVEVPKTEDGGKCEIITGTGDIQIMIE